MNYRKCSTRASRRRERAALRQDAAQVAFCQELARKKPLPQCRCGYTSSRLGGDARSVSARDLPASVVRSRLAPHSTATVSWLGSPCVILLRGEDMPPCPESTNDRRYLLKQPTMAPPTRQDPLQVVPHRDSTSSFPECRSLPGIGAGSLTDSGQPVR